MSEFSMLILSWLDLTWVDFKVIQFGNDIRELSCSRGRLISGYMVPLTQFILQILQKNFWKCKMNIKYMKNSKKIEVKEVDFRFINCFYDYVDVADEFTLYLSPWAKLISQLSHRQSRHNYWECKNVFSKKVQKCWGQKWSILLDFHIFIFFAKNLSI